MSNKDAGLSHGFSPNFWRLGVPNFSIPPPNWPNGHGRLPLPPFSPFPRFPPPPFSVFPRPPRPPAPVRILKASPSVPENEISEDQKWVNKWLQDRGKEKAGDDEKTNVELWDAKQLLSQAFKMANLLGQLQNEMAENIDMEEGEWQESADQVASVKKSLDGVKSQLSDPAVVDCLKRKIARNMRKKAYVKRSREKRQAEREKEKLEWEEKHREIDEWRAKRIAADIAKAREASVRLKAGETLSEVTSKQKDAQEMRDMLSTLRELRCLRREASRKKGKPVFAEQDEFFSTKISELEVFIEGLETVYKQEEKTLRVMMEEEGEAVEQEQLRLMQETSQKEQGAVIDETILDEQTEADYDPMKEFVDYYTQASRKLDALVGIRHLWDSFVVPPDFPGSSRVPDGWVVPAPPSSKAWEAYIVKDLEDNNENIT